MVPRAIPVTATVAVLALAANVTVAGTVATPAFSELKVTVKPPAGAGADNIKLRFSVAVPLMLAV